MSHVPLKRGRTFLAALLAGLFLTGAVVGTADAQEDKKTARIWKAKCASCHGEDGKGATEQGQKMGIGDMTKADFWKNITDEKFVDVVNNGFKRVKNGKEQEMKPMRDSIKPADVDALLKFTRAFVK